MNEITVSAKTLDDAITEASIQLGVASDQMEYDVIEKGSAGFLGIGSRQAVIRARIKKTVTEEIKAEEIKPEDLFCTVRIPLRHVGMGQMMALDPVEIEALAAKSNYPEYGISGRCNYITERGVRSLGLSGNKAQHADLTVELGFSSDMGVTNSRYPEEICEGQIQVNQGSMMGLSYDQLDVSTEEMENVDLYMQSLGVPARRNVNDPQVIKGEQNFYKAKCHLCHVTTLHTKTR